MIAYIGVEAVSNTGRCDLVDSTIVESPLSLVPPWAGLLYCFELSGELLSIAPVPRRGQSWRNSLVILGFRRWCQPLTV
jgi:hypothetical protein